MHSLESTAAPWSTMQECCPRSTGNHIFSRTHTIVCMQQQITSVFQRCRHMHTLTDTYMLSKWRTCKSSLQAEYSLVTSVQTDKIAFAEPAEQAVSPAGRCFQARSCQCWCFTTMLCWLQAAGLLASLLNLTCDSCLVSGCQNILSPTWWQFPAC